MRLPYILLVATAATLLASGSAAAASGRSTEVAAMATPDRMISRGTEQGETRLLRYHETVDEDEDDDDDYHVNENPGGDEGEEEEGDDDEERAGGANLFSVTKLDEMLQGTKRIARFERWKRYKFNPEKVNKILQNKGDYDDLYRKYRFWYYYKS